MAISGEFFQRAFAGDRALGQDGHLRAQWLEFSQNVAVDKHGVAFALQVQQQLANFASANRVDTIGWFVEQEQFWAVHQCLGNANTLLHAFGETANLFVSPCSHASKVKQLTNAASAFRATHALKPAVVMQQLLGREVGREAVVFGQVANTPEGFHVTYGLAEHCAFDVAGPNDRHQNLDQRRFSRTIGAQQAEYFASIDPHRHASQGLHAPAECLGRIADRNGGLVAHAGSVKVLRHLFSILLVMRHGKGLGGFLKQLEAAGELRRISERVSPLLAPAIASDREARKPAAVASTYAAAFDPMHANRGGHALLFEHVEGCDVPLAMNLYGSYRRMEMALGVEASGGIESIAKRLATLLEPTPPRGLGELLAKAKQFFPVLRMPPKLVRRGACQEIVQLSERGEVDVSRLPLIKCWPDDGDPAAVGWPLSAQDAGTASGQGRYITFAGMHTVHARDRSVARPASHNIGMYRAQLLGPTSLAMHWHVHHDGAAHWRSWKAIGERMPIAIALGGEPCLPYAATAPLPPGMSELLMAGLLNGRGIPLVKCATVPLRVPANAEIIIEGWVSTEAGGPGWLPDQGEPIGPGAVLEGPFGDHTGFYSLPDRYPVMEITAITRRHNAVFPATVVGPPPQEDYALGKATERIFKPLLQVLVPDIVDYHLPLPGCFHNMAVIGIHKHWPLQARRVMQAIWGAGQMAWTKCVVVVDAERVNVHDEEAVLREVFTHAHFGRDVVLTHGPLDILDHAATHLGAGGKMGIDATAFMDGEQAGTTCDKAPASVDIETIRQAVSHLSADVPQWGCGRCIVLQVSDERAGRGRSALGELATVLGAFDGLAIALGPDVDITDRDQVWFHLLANVDPMGDQVQVHAGIGLDATPKRAIDALPSRPVRAWPEALPVR